MGIIYGAVHTRYAFRAQRSEEWVVGVFYKEVDLVLETMKISPALCLVDIPKTVRSSSQHNGQIGLPRSRHRETEIPGVQHPIDPGAAKRFVDPQLLLFVSRHDDPENPAAFSQQRQTR